MFFISLSARNFDTNPNFEKYLLDKCKVHRINSLINCAAVINSKECQDNPKLAYIVNAELPGLLSNVCSTLDIEICSNQYRSCIWFWPVRSIRSESDTPKPKNIYGKSKRDGELNIHPSSKHIILRLPRIISTKTQLFSSLVNKIIKGEEIKVAKDIFSTPISSICSAERIINIVLGEINLFNKK